MGRGGKGGKQLKGKEDNGKEEEGREPRDRGKDGGNKRNRHTDS